MKSNGKKNGTSPTKNRSPLGRVPGCASHGDIHSGADGSCVELRCLVEILSSSTEMQRETLPILRQLHLTLHNRIYNPKMSMYCIQNRYSARPRLRQPRIPDRQLLWCFPPSASLLLIFINIQYLHISTFIPQWSQWNWMDDLWVAPSWFSERLIHGLQRFALGVHASLERFQAVGQVLGRNNGAVLRATDPLKCGEPGKSNDGCTYIYILYICIYIILHLYRKPALAWQPGSQQLFFPFTSCSNQIFGRLDCDITLSIYSKLEARS